VDSPHGEFPFRPQALKGVEGMTVGCRDQVEAIQKERDGDLLACRVWANVQGVRSTDGKRFSISVIARSTSVSSISGMPRSHVAWPAKSKGSLPAGVEPGACR
jgi:hypothetical protein